MPLQIIINGSEDPVISSAMLLSLDGTKEMMVSVVNICSWVQVCVV